MTDKSDIIEEHLLGRKLIGVWEMISDSSPTTVEGYALSLEGYFLEIETMLDVSAIDIACGHSRIDFPLDVRLGCSYHEVSHDSPFSQLLGKRLSHEVVRLTSPHEPSCGKYETQLDSRTFLRFS